MADRLWTDGSGDHLWSTAGNWSGAAVPVDNDRAFFDPSQGGSKTSVTGGLSQGGIDLDLLYMHESYTGDVGSSSTPLQISADEVRFLAAGRLFISSHNGGAADKIDRFFVRAPSVSSSAQVEINSVSGSAGEVDFLHILRGNVTLKTTLTGVDLLEVGDVNGSGDVIMTFDSGGSVTLALVRQWGGKVTSNFTITNIHQAGGEWFQETNPITNLYGSAGRCIYNSSSTIVLADIGGSHVLDFTRSARARTVTTIVAQGNADYVYDPGLVTFTNTFDYRNRTRPVGT